MTEEAFFGQFSFVVDLQAEPGNRAFFGQNVLQGLVDGIDDFVQQRQPRWERRTCRIGAPALLGCSPWVNDPALLAAIEMLPGACIVISKAPQRSEQTVTFRRLHNLNSRTTGIELRALSAELGNMAPIGDGRPRVVGPYDRINDEVSLSTFRTIGYRKADGTYPPIAHAKLALLGNICWTDEHPAGGVDDYVWFSPRRLWVSSANFTRQSRTSAEFGYWTEDADLLDAVKSFLSRLIGESEDLDSAAKSPDPQLAEVEFDDEAMADAAAESYRARLESAELRGEELDPEDW